MIIEAIVQAISDHARVLLQKWGQENAPPPADIYSLDNIQGSGLHVIQKTFQGDFEVLIPLPSPLLTPVRRLLQLQILAPKNNMYSPPSLDSNCQPPS